MERLINRAIYYIMKFKSVSNICFRKVFYAYHFARMATVRIFIEIVRYSLARALYRDRSSFDNQLLISYTLARDRSSQLTDTNGTLRDRI